jgi:hypothetical protein
VRQETEEHLETSGLLEALGKTANKDQPEAQEQLVTKELQDQPEILAQEARQVPQGLEVHPDSQVNLVFKVQLVWLVIVDSPGLKDRPVTEVQLDNRVQLDLLVQLVQRVTLETLGRLAQPGRLDQRDLLDHLDRQVQLEIKDHLVQQDLLVKLVRVDQQDLLVHRDQPD